MILKREIDRYLLSWKNVKNNQIIRIYDGEFKKEKIEIKNKKSELISIPFYLIPCYLEKII